MWGGSYRENHISRILRRDFTNYSFASIHAYNVENNRNTEYNNIIIDFNILEYRILFFCRRCLDKCVEKNHAYPPPVIQKKPVYREQFSGLYANRRKVLMKTNTRFRFKITRNEKKLFTSLKFPINIYFLLRTRVPLSKAVQILRDVSANKLICRAASVKLFFFVFFTCFKIYFKDRISSVFSVLIPSTVYR